MPTTAKGLAAELDGNPDAINEVVLALEEVSENNPAVAEWWSSVKPKVTSGGGLDAESFVPEVISSLGLKEKTGVQGRKPTAEQTVNQSPAPATAKAERGVLGAVPAGKGGKKPAAEKPAAAKPAAEKPAAKPQPAKAPAAQSETDAYLDSDEAPIPGLMGATRSEIADRTGGMSLMPEDYLEHALAEFDADGDGVSDAPTPAPAPQPSAQEMSQFIAANTPSPLAQLLDTAAAEPASPPAMDMARLSSRAFQPPQAPPATWGDLDAGWMQAQQPSPQMPDPYEAMGEFAQTLDGGAGDTPPATPPKEAPWSPLTSRSDAFFKSRGLDGLAQGARYLTKPVDAYVRNWGLTVPATIGAGLAHAAMSGSANPVTEDQIKQAEERAAAALQRAQQGWAPLHSPR